MLPALPTGTMHDYDLVASVYDLGYDDWEGMMARYVDYIKPIFEKNGVNRVLDCSCGTGLQAIGLAKEGYEVTGSDVSPEMIEVAKMNAAKYHVSVDFVNSSFVDLERNVEGKFDAVITMDNALPHVLNDQELVLALKNILAKLKPDNGICLIDIWNYVTLIEKKRRFIPIVTRDDAVVVQVRDFETSDRVDLSILYFVKSNGGWQFQKTEMKNRVITSDQLQHFLLEAGFRDLVLNVDVLWVRALARTSHPTLKSLATGLAGVAAPSVSKNR